MIKMRDSKDLDYFSYSAPKRVGGTAVASQLYRTSSFSSGRSSAHDQEDMYSDASLEDDVLDLNQKVQMLQQQVGVLADSQINTDDRFSRVKQDNAGLQARVIMLEEQLRESEMRGEDRLAEEIRRNKELMQRVERERELQSENFNIRNASLDKDRLGVCAENQRIKEIHEKSLKDIAALEERLSDFEHKCNILQEDNTKITSSSKRDKEELKYERERSSQVIEELRSEIERLRAVEESFRKRSPSIDSSFGNHDMETEIKELREENKSLHEQLEDLQAQLLTTQLEEGRTLVSQTNNDSLAAEFEQMTNDELRQSLKETQEANVDLRTYIDGILLNIVDNYPQLLEVKHN